MNVLPECFSRLTIVRESAGSGRDGGWGERVCVHMNAGEGVRKEGTCMCTRFSIVIIIIT